MSIQLSPLNENQLSALSSLTSGLSRDQTVWLSGYFQGLLASNGQQKSVPAEPVTASKTLKILYGTHTGRSKLISEKLAACLNGRGIGIQVLPLDNYKPRQLAGESNVVFVVSTHGEGEPPAMAEEFHGFITGKRLSKLPNLNYSVVALGDKSYKLFCKTGLDIDQALAGSGANPILPVLTLDVDYEDEADQWIAKFVAEFTASIPETAHAPLNASNSSSGEKIYSRKNPFKATVIDKVKITGRDSDKEVYHVELSLEGSGITYEPGDSVGILASNPPELVDAIIRKAGLDKDEAVGLKDGNYSLETALSDHLEITVLTRDVIQKYQEFTQNQELQKVLANESLLDDYLYGHDVLDLLEEFPYPFDAQELVGVLRSFPSRLYSISSSQDSVGDEVHITVSTVRYANKGRQRGGACSTYLADRIEIDSTVSVYIEKNPSFKLPESHETPVILIGAGTGVAPYRAFLQHREANNLKGNTWLFFGERKFHSDFLYQVEWQKLIKDGFLERIDVAFSRDQKEKIYVQNRLVEKQHEVIDWLNNKGASIYLCGDMKQMARDVQATLVRIFETAGGMTPETAQEYLKKLKRDRRFQLDVY